MAKGNNPTILRQNASIGKLSAEQDDEFLFDSFVFHPLLDEILDAASRTMVILGRTGSGKTAIMRKIEGSGHKSRSLDLVDMTMDYVTNSDVIRFLAALGIDLDLFFQALWKHLLCIEFIRLRFGADDELRSKNFLERIADRFSFDGKRKRAIEYLRKWQGKFWITADENIKELTQQLESRVGADLGVEIEKFKAKAGYERTLSAEKRSEIVSRAKKFVNAEQIAELSSVLDMLGEFESDQANRSFLLIDRIDEKWVDESMRFKLIRALVECLKSFRKIPSLKIVVAIRSDVYERVLLENHDLGFQREKYDDYATSLDWNSKQLKELVDKRVRTLYRKKYTKQDVNFEDLFPLKVGGVEPFSYLLDRTLYRPRDIVAFVNECLLSAVGQHEVAPKHIKNAEADYSRKRLEALVDEWKSTFPSLETSVRLLKRERETFAIGDIAARELLQDIILIVAVRDDWQIDPLSKLSKIYTEASSTSILNEIAFLLVSQMYRIGIVGVKLNPDRRYEYSHLDNPILSEGTLTLETKVRIHPMFHRALGVGPMVS